MTENPISPVAICPSPVELASAVSGVLSDVKSAPIFEHLTRCNACIETLPGLMVPDELERALRASSHSSAKTQLDLDFVDEVISRVKRISSSSNNNSATFVTPNDLKVQPLETRFAYMAPPVSPDEIGWLGGYRVLKPLDRGGMGIVFQGEDPQLKRFVALKVMKSEYASDPAARKRYLREAQAIAALRHDHIVTIYQVGEQSGMPFLAMELLKGESLDARLRRESRLPIKDVLRIGREIAEGLSAAHGKGLVHRDIKPSNVWLEHRDTEGRVSKSGLVDPKESRAGQSCDIASDSARTTDADLTPDFPLAKCEGNGETVDRVKLLDFGLASSSSDNLNLTSLGAILGTPSFMAPEQASGVDVDARADLFSLGVILYRMTTGQLPFAGKNVMEILNSLATVNPTPVHLVNPNVPRELSNLIVELMAKDVKSRPESAAKVAGRLAEIERATMNAAPPIRNFGRIATALGGMAVLLIFLSVVIVTIKSKDGKETKVVIDASDDVESITAKVGEGGAVTEISKSKDPQTSNRAHAPSGSNNTVESNDVLNVDATKFITLAALDNDKIPESERFEWQPKELVAVIGSDRLRNWWSISNVVFHPSGEFFVSTSQYGQARVWSTKTLKLLMEDGEPGFPDSYTGVSICFSPDGKFFYAGRGKYAVDLTDPVHPNFRLLAKRPEHKIREYERPVISPDGRWMVMAGRPSGILEVWDISGNVPRFVKEIIYPKEYGENLVGSPSGHILAIGETAQILVWNVEWDAPDGPTLTQLGEPLPGLLVAFGPDDNTLIRSRLDAPESDQILDLNVTPPRVLHEFERAGAKIAPDGNMLAVNMGEISLRRKTAMGWEEQTRIPTTNGSNCNFWFSPDGKTLIVTEYDFGIMRAWDLTTMPPTERIMTRHYRAAQFSPDGRILVTTGGEAHAAWKLDGESPVLMAELGVGTSYTPTSFAPPSFTPDSTLVAIAGHVNFPQVFVWNLSLPVPQLISDWDTQFIRFAPSGTAVQICDGKRISSQSWDVTKRGKFQLGSSTVITKLPNEMLMPDRQQQNLLVSGLRTDIDRYLVPQQNGKLQVMSLKEDQKVIAELQHPDQTAIYQFALSEDGNLVAAFTHSGKKSLVWDLTESPPRDYLLTNNSDWAADPFFTTDDKLLVVASHAGIEIHDWAHSRLVRTIKYPGPAKGMARHPDGVHVATVNGNGTVYILRIPELAEHNLRHGR